MENRKIGRSGLNVSVLALGGHIFPSEAGDYYPGFHGRRIVEDAAYDRRFPVIEAAVESGVTLFAADFKYEAQSLGRALHTLNVRSRVALTAVVDFRLSPDVPPPWDDLEPAIDRMLQWLDTDHLELPQIRVENRYLTNGLLEDLVGRLHDIQFKGKITCPIYYAPDSDIEVMREGLERGWFHVAARAFGILNPNPRKDLLPWTDSSAKGFLGFVPFQKGWLFDCGREAGLTDFEIAKAGLAWILLKKGVTSVLTGASGPEEVRQNAQALESGASEEWLDQVIKRLTETSAYERFLSQVKKLAPQLSFDWRDMG